LTVNRKDISLRLTHFSLDVPRFVLVSWGDSPCANQSTVLTYRIWACGRVGGYPTVKISRGSPTVKISRVYPTEEISRANPTVKISRGTEEISRGDSREKIAHPRDGICGLIRVILRHLRRYIHNVLLILNISAKCLSKRK